MNLHEHEGALLKTVDRKVRGFESLSLRPSAKPEFMGAHVESTAGVSALLFAEKRLLRQRAQHLFIL
jgi:hypothetical protein